MSDLQNSLSEKTDGIRERGEDLEKEYSRFRGAATRVVHDGKTIAQRWCNEGLSAAKGLSGNAAERIKHDPVPAAAITFGLGLVAGALIGWLLAHESGVEDIIESAQRATST